MMPGIAQPRAQAVARISRVVADLDRAEAFYRAALGFTPVARARLEPDVRAILGAGDAEQAVLRLGAQEIALVRFDRPGAPPPAHSRSDDLWFQHLAIAVGDMRAAYAHLAAQAGWRPISEHGPELLPPANGSVQAMKFRDPDGHPLELLWFPPGAGRAAWRRGEAMFLGIDHTALAVSHTPRSAGFYRGLGFAVSARSLNHGPAQSRLDALPQAQVRITALRPPSAASAGIELLRYRPAGRAMPRAGLNDGLTDWITLAVEPPPPGGVMAMRDPDGHLLVLAAPGGGASGAAAIGSPA
jgi:catechol 2,3-dioxygenase-like lactoylglutathione lyase family enzyme